METIKIDVEITIPGDVYDSHQEAALYETNGQVSGTEVLEDYLRSIIMRYYGPDAKVKVV